MLSHDDDQVAIDPRAILTSISQVVYSWRMADDTLIWGSNVGEVLRIKDLERIKTGRGYARFMDPDNTASRTDAIASSDSRDTGAGVPYRIQYAINPSSPIDRDRLWVEDTGRWFAGADGKPSRAHGVIRVINAQRDSEERLNFLASFDELTGQLNRQRLTEALNAMIEDARRVRKSLGFLIVSVEGISAINEAYGFAVADEAIASVARRIRTRMRAGDTLGRYSGNKFGIVLANCDTEEMPIAADRFIDAVTEDPIVTSVGPVNVRVSVGGILAPRFAGSANEAMCRAQEALDLCRSTRRGGFMAYLPSSDRDEARRANARVTEEVLRALNERRIVLCYQPIVDARTGAVVHDECLVRLRNVDGADIPATAIVPIIEKLGLIRLIDNRVLELAVDELERAPSRHLAINLSAATFADQDWLAALAIRLHRRPDLAGRLTVEITESAAIADLSAMASFIRLMKEYGVKVAIDDFGAGYTSFRALRELDVDAVKIDGIFIQNLSRSADDRFFVRTLIDLAKHLRLKVVAEWVQDETTAHLLTEWGCDYLQGSLYGMGSVETPIAAQPTVRRAV